MRLIPYFTLLVALSSATWVMGEVGHSQDCQSYYAADDPRLFDFLDTREAIDYTAFEGLTITDIEPVVLPIFNENDPKENYLLYRVANTLHIDTQNSTVTKKLTFQEQQQLNERVIEENERILRNSDYFSGAMIVPHRVCGDQIELLTVVRDVWTLSPSASFSRAGGENTSDVGISESNLLGTGQSLAIGRFSNSDRSGVSASYGNDHLFGNHTELDISYSDNSDGHVKELSLERPFYSLNSSTAAGIYYLHETRIDEITNATETLNSFRTDIEKTEVYYGWSRGLINNTSRRWTVGLTDDTTSYYDIAATQIAPPIDRRLRYPWLSFESIEDQYWTARNVSQIGRQEDIRLGAYWFARAGYASDAWGSNENALIYHIRHQYTLSVGRHHLLQMTGGLNGRYNTDQNRAISNLLTLETRYNHFIDKNNRWHARLRIDVAHNIDQNEQLTSGGDDNLRGYPNDTQRGDQRVLFTVERRHFSDWHIFNLIRVGAATYIDIGRTRDTQTPGATNTVTLANVGAGLRFSSSKASQGRVVHVDIAAPLRNRRTVDRYQLLITGKSTF